jgi:hypothetical protein
VQGLSDLAAQMKLIRNQMAYHVKTFAWLFIFGVLSQAAAVAAPKTMVDAEEANVSSALVPEPFTNTTDLVSRQPMQFAVTPNVLKGLEEVKLKQVASLAIGLRDENTIKPLADVSYRAQDLIAEEPQLSASEPSPTLSTDETVQPSLLPPLPTGTETSPPVKAPIPKRAAANKTHYSVIGEQYYYGWSDNLGNRGSQWITPVTFTVQKGNFDFGVRTAYINSSFDGVLLLDGVKIGTRKGSVSTISDTSVSLAYTFKKSAFPVRFNLDFNVPTGKATLVGDEKNAIMDGALVQQTRFGEGFNIAPGISISHAFGKKDVVGVGISHIFRGEFDPNGDVDNDKINPGNETVATLQYQHLEKNWLVIGGLIYTNYGVTQRGGLDYYQSGDRLDANATLVYSISPRHRIQFTGRYFTQGKNDVVNFLSGNLDKESANSNGNALFLNFDYGIGLDKQQRHTLHFLADYLTVNANSYDRINDLFNAGRDKFSVGLGYDCAISSQSKISFQAKYFHLSENATPVTQQAVKSDGVNLFASLNYIF